MGLEELIASRRTFGRVDEYDDEYVETEFVCITPLRLPVLPVRSLWIMAHRRRRGSFPIRLHRRSVLASYLRWWPPVLAAPAVIASSSPAAIAAGPPLAALWAASWTWLLRSPHELRRASFDLAAFGSRCDPARMTAVMRDALAGDLARQVVARSDGRPPDDVVRFGATSIDEALVAYSVLR